MKPKRLFHKPLELANLLIRNGHVFDPNLAVDRRLDILIRDGDIVELAEANTLQVGADVELLEAQQLTVLPAFCDPHVHLRTPGQNHKETIATGTAAAAAGGYSLVVAMPNTTPTIDSVVTLEAVNAIAAREAVVPVGVMAAVTHGLNGEQLTDMSALRDAGAIGFTDDGRPVTNPAMMRSALSYQRLCGGVIALHEEDPQLSAGGSMHEGAVSARLGIAGIPSISESTMIARDAAIAGYEDGRIHIQHLSAVESVEAVAAAKAAGIKITAEVSPHHLTLTDESIDGTDTNFKMNPPLRSEQHRQALIEGFKSGVIDCIATDHAPHAAVEKGLPFEIAPMGTTGLESAFAVLYTDLVQSGVLTLKQVVTGLVNAGSVYDLEPAQIAVGQRANLCLVDLEQRWTLKREGYSSLASNCCFNGKAVTGRVTATVAAGAVVYRADRREGQ